MNTMISTSTIQNDIEEILGLRDMSEEEQGSFLHRVGELIIESAVLKYVVSLSDEDRFTFDVWLEAYHHDERLLEVACETYPLFAETLTNEMDVFQSEAKRLFGVTK